ncbi:MAG: hypothetical protein V1916_00360 [Patescibacteria group bacterium]
MPTTHRTAEAPREQVPQGRPLPFSPRSRTDVLALEVASALRDETRLPLYRMYCQQYDEQLVRRALATVQAVPDEKIKKSRPALFIFLLKQYAASQG